MSTVSSTGWGFKWKTQPLTDMNFCKLLPFSDYKMYFYLAWYECKEIFPEKYILL